MRVPGSSSDQVGGEYTVSEPPPPPPPPPADLAEAAGGVCIDPQTSQSAWQGHASDVSAGVIAGRANAPERSKVTLDEIRPGADLSGRDLSGLDLSGRDLTGVDLSGADLSGANLTRAVLHDADLSGADLSNASLHDADVSSADLSRARLSNADLSDADLHDADVSGADLSDADLANADLSDADLSRADLSNADLSRADLANSDLFAADLSNADLSGADLSSADLSEADLSNADLSSADLWYADLSGADLANADLEGASSETIGRSTADRVAGWFRDRADDARSGIDTIDRGLDAVGDRVSDGFRDTVREARETASGALDRLRGGVDALADGARDTIDDVRRSAEEAVEAGERIVNRAGEEIVELGEDIEEGIRDGVETISRGAEQVIDAGRQVIDSVSTQLDAEEQVRALDSDGDSVVYELGAFAQVEVRGEAAGKAEVKQVGEDPDERYEVTISGEAGLGIVAELGGSVGGEAKLEGQVMGRAGASVVLTFDNPEDAARAVRIAGQTVAAGAVAGAVAGPTAGLGAPIAAMALGPDAEDMAFMTEHMSALELQGGISAELSASLGIGLDQDQLRLAGASLKIGGDRRIGARITFPRDGNPARLTVFAQGQIQAAGGLGLGLSQTRTGGSGGSLGVGAGAQGQLQARAEMSFDLPHDVDLAALRADPQGVLLDQADRMARSSQIQLTLSGEGRAHATGAGGTARGFEVQLQARPHEIAGAIETIAEQGLAPGLRELDDSVTVSGKTTRTDQTGFRLTPEITALGVGVGVTVAAERNDQTVTSEATGHPSELYAWLEEQLGEPAVVTP